MPPKCGTDFFKELPIELREKILEYLTVQDLLNCSLVSKSWRSHVNMDIVWRNHCFDRRFLPKTVDQLDPSFLLDKLDEDTVRFNNLIVPTLEPLCNWRKIFSWHNRLRNNWIDRTYTRYGLSTEKCESPVFCLDSDGVLAVSGHEDASVTVWNVQGKPYHVTTFSGALNRVPVMSLCVWQDYILILQRRLLQTYKREDSGRYEMVDAKTFELGPDNMSVTDKINLLGESFDFWYKECVRVSENLTLRRLVFGVCEGLVLGAVRGAGELGVWRLDGAPRACLAGFHSIRTLLVVEGQAYVVSDSGATVVSRYSLAKNEAEQVLRVPGWKKVVISEQYVIAFPNRMDTSLKQLSVWDRGHRLLSTRRLAFGQVSVAAMGALVVYTENAAVTVWDPRSDTVLNSFSAGANIGFVKPAFSTLLLVFVNASVHVWDFMEGKRLYRIYSELEWNGDFRDQLWLNPAMIIAGGVEKQMELLNFMN